MNSYDNYTVQRMSRPFMPGPIGDPFWANVVLLAFNEQGPNNGTTFVDASNAARVLTTVGNTKWTTTAPPPGLTSSAIFAVAGSGDRITSPDAADLELGTSDFTIECVFRPIGSIPSSRLVGKGDPFGWEITQIFGAPGQAKFYASSNGSTYNIANGQVMGDITQDAWHHAEVGRSGSNFFGFLNGVQGFTFSSALALMDDTSLLSLGSRTDNALRFLGTIAGVRITKGVCRHTANFTPPTLPLPPSP